MYVTYLLLAVTILVSVKGMADESFKRKMMLNPYDVIHYKKWYRMFTHGFVHADYMHLAFNMFVLYSFGILELFMVARFGPRGYMLFALLYLSAILFSSLIALQKHKDNPYYNSLGASGAVMAVLFAYILVFPTARLNLIFLPIPGGVPAYVFGPLILLFEYIMAKRGGTRIAHDAHLAGAIFGILFMTALDYNYILNFFNHFVS